jgi:2-keto-3-deoxy-L-rhamnonate aldolase RhmA
MRRGGPLGVHRGIVPRDSWVGDGRIRSRLSSVVERCSTGSKLAGIIMRSDKTARNYLAATCLVVTLSLD